MTNENGMELRLFGRSSSHFTRVARIFAAELGVDYEFEIVRDILNSSAATFGDNPALKVPALRTPEGLWLGSNNVCRELARRSRLGRRVVWPEELEGPLLANAQELVLQAMGAEVTLVMDRLAGVTDSAYHAKLRRSIEQTLSWLDANAPRGLAALPKERDLSFLEVTLFCFVTHLEFRELAPTEPYAALNAFCRAFSARPAASATAYRFDA